MKEPKLDIEKMKPKPSRKLQIERRLIRRVIRDAQKDADRWRR